MKYIHVHKNENQMDIDISVIFGFCQNNFKENSVEFLGQVFFASNSDYKQVQAKLM